MDRVLIADNGMTYTNGFDFSKEIWLGLNDSPENWYQITDKEAEERLKEIEVSADGYIDG